ncbi:uncharacterized protein LOC122757125 [Drosophila mojavensis]|uniref:uncharacterized protein LOC122757125 n=1 Tax=Drosophila mojavensis TaxID=7230 RepID=UPI001CD18ADC|nr:uncharacterized protein LOC122757125 [Drosophila mojavensis]
MYSQFKSDIPLFKAEDYVNKFDARPHVCGSALLQLYGCTAVPGPGPPSPDEANPRHPNGKQTATTTTIVAKLDHQQQQQQQQRLQTRLDRQVSWRVEAHVCSDPSAAIKKKKKKKKKNKKKKIYK